MRVPPPFVFGRSDITKIEGAAQSGYTFNVGPCKTGLEDGRPTRIYAVVVIIIAKPVQSFFTDDNET